jgi:hypothetical protein
MRTAWRFAIGDVTCAVCSPSGQNTAEAVWFVAIAGHSMQSSGNRQIVFTFRLDQIGPKGDQMKKSYLICAACFRWFMVGLFTFIIALPTLVSISTEI